ncbi:hypothetical protein RchiOBHm_Chr7g0196261 [Rosa chinensis]|uniref:Uncharacterized protein n=1 Tax=Rosa chinensis TaxID=74649 RepID=A0A2P6P6J0_ROSCH|nr:hypothetical protein RchiOBHm_Chr7g0196261 [Rosa chinensis]
MVRPNRSDLGLMGISDLTLAYGDCRSYLLLFWTGGLILLSRRPWWYEARPAIKQPSFFFSASSNVFIGSVLSAIVVAQASE